MEKKKKKGVPEKVGPGQNAKRDCFKILKQIR